MAACKGIHIHLTAYTYIHTYKPRSPPHHTIEAQLTSTFQKWLSGTPIALYPWTITNVHQYFHQFTEDSHLCSTSTAHRPHGALCVLAYPRLEPIILSAHQPQHPKQQPDTTTACHTNSNLWPQPRKHDCRREIHRRHRHQRRFRRSPISTSAVKPKGSHLRRPRYSSIPRGRLPRAPPTMHANTSRRRGRPPLRLLCLPINRLRAGNRRRSSHPTISTASRRPGVQATARDNRGNVLCHAAASACGPRSPGRRTVQGPRCHD